MTDEADNVTDFVTMYDEENLLEHTEWVIHTHRAEHCMGDRCTIHKRSDHSMRAFPQHFRTDRGIMERVCPHGIGHPDPDDYAVQLSKAEGIHGCDGCCGGQVGEYDGQWHRDLYGGD